MQRNQLACPSNQGQNRRKNQGMNEQDRLRLPTLGIRRSAKRRVQAFALPDKIRQPSELVDTQWSEHNEFAT